MLSKLYPSPLSESSESLAASISLIADEEENFLVVFFVLQKDLFIKSSGVNVSGRVNCLITQLISIWPSLIWALMGLCCLGFVWICVCGPVFMVHTQGIFLMFNCDLQKLASYLLGIHKVSVPNRLSVFVVLNLLVNVLQVHSPCFMLNVIFRRSQN